MAKKDEKKEDFLCNIEMQYVMLCNSIGHKGINFCAKQQIYLQKCFEKGKGKLKVLHLMIVEQGWCDGG